MTPPPTSIDGTDITGATIDGQDVEEITVDGDVVFSATSLPVAFSDLIAWYPMEANISGGDEYSDATALFSGSADSTPYDLIDEGAVFDASFGVTDLNQGANSGSFENVDESQYLVSNVPLSIPITISTWYYEEGGGPHPYGTYQDTDFFYYQATSTTGLNFDSGQISFVDSKPSDQWLHSALSIAADGSATFVYDRDTTSTGNVSQVGGQLEILNIGSGRTSNSFAGYVDDFRIYNTALSVGEIQDIFDNTSP